MNHNGDDKEMVEEQGMGNGNEVMQLKKELEEARQMAEKYRDESMRSLADLDNYRKRLMREREEIRKTVTLGVMEQVLPVIDNLAMGLESAGKVEGANVGYLEGFRMVLNQLKGVLSQNGVREINPKGEVFNPAEQECVSMMVSDDIEENYVMEVLRTGYSVNDRLIRPATVVVSKGKE